jgi:hypothetical protein
MIRIIIFLLTLIPFCGLGQTSYEITGFSEKYKARLHIDEGYETEIFKRGTIVIIETNTNKEIISIDSPELSFELDEQGNVRTNVVEVPYGQQSIIISGDFNFDGQNDLAIMDGQFSCYHGPSFQIYLETRDGLRHSAEFSRLSQEYCGMFSLDKEAKKIHTMTKSGCCWHQFSEFVVEENIPVEIKVVEEGLHASGLLWEYVERVRVGKTMKERTFSRLVEDADISLVFALYYKSGKMMELYSAYNDFLFYIFKDKDQNVELFYANDFTYDATRNTLTFSNEGTQYLVYSTGILVNMPRGQVDLKADSSKANSSLANIKQLKLQNVHLQ